MQEQKCDAVLLLSGGIDSTTALYKLVKKEGKRVMCLIFDYGQSLIKEVDVAKANAERLGQPYKILKIDLSFSGSQCSLISKNKIATGRNFDAIDGAIPTSYVEFRNGILLSYAVMLAEANGIHEIYGGFNGLASGQYYDDTIEFVKAFEKAANKGTKPGYEVKIIAPWAKVEKSEIVKQGLAMGLDYKTTWSCYKNGAKHCGKCDSCLQRERALKNGGFKK